MEVLVTDGVAETTIVEVGDDSLLAAEAAEAAGVVVIVDELEAAAGPCIRRAEVGVAVGVVVVDGPMTEPVCILLWKAGSDIISSAICDTLVVFISFQVGIDRGER